MTTYISLDVETDGPCPGINSMLQLGAAAFDENAQLLESVSYNLATLSEATAHLPTMNWWAQNEAAYEATRVCPYAPVDAMNRFSSWVQQFPKPSAICYPAGFDFTWVYWYLHRFTGNSPFGFQALDIKSYAAAVMKVPYHKAAKKYMPKRWFERLPDHTHDACQDAIEQGMLFFAIRKDSNDQHQHG